MAHEPVAFKKTKHIMRVSHYLRDLVARRVMGVFTGAHGVGTAAGRHPDEGTLEVDVVRLRDLLLQLFAA